MKDANPTIHVLIADDHQVFLEGLNRILEDEPKIKIVGLALDGIQALKMLNEQYVDVAVLDYAMPNMSGLEALNVIRKEHPLVKSLILSFADDGKVITEVMKAGAKGYVLKNRSSTDLLEAIRAVAAGKSYFPEEIISKYTDYLQLIENQKNKIDNHRLSEREADVVSCMMEGMPAKLIAEELCISKNTVDTHKKNIQKRFGLQNGNQIVLLGRERGIQPWSVRRNNHK